MKVIFLDYDGVLFHIDCYVDPRTRRRPRGHGRPGRRVQPDPACIMWLAQLVRQTGAYIVVSSTWRGRRRLGLLRDLMQSWGLPNARRRLIGMTGRKRSSDEGGRGAEILEWLNAHPSVTEYVVIDDDPIEQTPGLDRRRIINVRQGYFTGGLRSYHAARAARVLGCRKFSYHAEMRPQRPLLLPL